MNKNKNETTENIEKSALQAGWDNFTDFLREAFLKTPFETIMEFILLVAGGSRTYSFMSSMGQSAWLSIIALVYAEFGIIFWEVLGYKGKRVKYDYVTKKTGKHYKSFPTFNQKSLSKIGLWIVHIPMTVIFTMSDVIKSNLEANMSTNVGFDETFAWVLGGMIGFSFFMDLILIINYRNTNPQHVHDEEMNQLLYDKEKYLLDKERVAEETRLRYLVENQRPLETLRAKLNARAEIFEEFGGKFDEEFINSQLEEVEMGLNGKNSKVGDDKNNKGKNTKNNSNEQNSNEEQNKKLEEIQPKEEKSPELSEGQVDDDTNFTLPQNQVEQEDSMETEEIKPDW